MPSLPLLAFKVTEPQYVPEFGVTTTCAGNGFTVIVIVFEVAGEPVKHGLALEVKIQVTKSPLANELEVNVVEFEPTFEPLICHWY